MAKRRPFRIVHFSDLHLTPSDTRARSEPRLFGALRGMNQAFRDVLQYPAVQNADYVLVTGDVTDRGDLASWKVFWTAVRASGLTKRIRVLPGNHDVCWLGAARLPKRGLRSSDLKKAIAGLTLGGQPVKFPWVVVPDPRIAVFGLNSNNLGNLTGASNALGDIGYYQLKSLASKLYQHRHVPVKIVALHHSPNIPEEATAVRRGQRPFGFAERLTHQLSEDDRHSVILLCVAHRVRLLIHGHLHMCEDRRITGVRIVGAPATTQPLDRSAAKKLYQFFSYNVHGNGGRVHCALHTVGSPS